MSNKYDSIETLLMNMSISQKAIEKEYNSMSSNLDETWKAMRELHASLVSVSKGVIPKEALEDIDICKCKDLIDEEGFIHTLDNIRKKISERYRLGGYIKIIKELIELKDSLLSKKCKLYERLSYLSKTHNLGIDYRHSADMQSKVKRSIGIVDTRIQMVLECFFNTRLETIKLLDKYTSYISKTINDYDMIRSVALKYDDANVSSRMKIAMNKLKKECTDD